ncbi:DUF2116 family Zn-ribbon domain-containing protein [Mucilaginibacter segetis]|uniref:DUF2116 family Zn-ribbon domain-containing protein n=1 Tax=Mucilaginibacter segetis TaxID=2793071 RepID=A0A934PUG7_9SPHI|nr:DUF2116 family Zn-ribbon domain-containing protein [Mucilaginibacter segetis]MBK0379361.1 DUF2116 family Zn-ribbon domain-containing protein [Mucilaginibacter segetis]
MEEKLCLDCGTPIKVGRKDKKFCDDTCRTNYNNNKDKTELSVGDYIKKIQNILEKNRQILDEVLGPDRDKRSIDKRDLLGRGFNVKYFTSRAPTRQGDIYCFCFELGFREFEDETIMVVRREREVIC